MDERIQKKEIVCRLASRMKTDEATAALWVDAILDTLYESFSHGQSVTLSGFGNFYVRPTVNTEHSSSILRRSCAHSSVGRPLTKVACECEYVAKQPSENSL